MYVDGLVVIVIVNSVRKVPHAHHTHVSKLCLSISPTIGDVVGSGMIEVQAMGGRTIFQQAKIKIEAEENQKIFIHSFIHSCLGRWANHDHLTNSLKHIINQTNI